MRPCAVIPHFESRGAVAEVLRQLAELGLPTLVVDDGSRPEELRTVRAACREAGAELIERPRNGGKGAAMKDGLRAAAARGFSHALQVDADGQHCCADVPAFLEAARARPETLVLCSPRYGKDAPLGRILGRQISRFWVVVETLSRDIADPFVGFRIYPLESCMAAFEEGGIGDRMDFDLDIAVRLHWLGVPVVNVPSVIRYPEGGVSHFRMLSDNLLISRAHARLCFGMFVRAPRILVRRLRR